MKYWKRKAALLLSALMLGSSLCPTAAYAAEPETEAVELTESEEEAELTEGAEEADVVEETDAAEENDAALEAELVEATARIEAVTDGPMDSQPMITENTTSMTLVKGQKFVLSDNTWISSDKKILSVSKTKATAKKGGTVKLTHGAQSIDVTVVEPYFEKKSVTMMLGVENSISLNNVAGLEVLYISLKPDVVYAGEDGSVGGLSKGSAVVNAYVNGVVFKYTAKVVEVDTSKRDFTKPVELAPMQSVNIKLNGFKPAKAAWTSDTMVSANEVPKGYVFEDSVVRINKNGKITAIGTGQTVITAAGGSAEPVVITVNVPEPCLRLMHMEVGSSKPFKFYGVKGNVDWKPLNESDNMVTITKNKVKANVTGVELLSAKVEKFEYTAVIFVEDSTIVNEDIRKKGNKYTLDLNTGSTAKLKYKSIYQTIIYKSSDCSVAYADEFGIIHARNKGTAKLSGKINGKAITVTVKVEGNDKPDKDL